MMTDQDVETLYRCLLGRAPETPDTIAAFKAYYGDFVRGRTAILQSAEFAGLFTAIAGAAPARLAHGFLRRAGGDLPTDANPSNAALIGAMRLILRAHAHVHLAVVVGDAATNVSDFMPLEKAGAAVLHVAPHFPAFLPQVETLAGGATLFRIRFDAASLGEFLRDCGLHIDMLVLLQDAPMWLESLRPVIAPRAILLGATGLAEATHDWPGAERAVELCGLAVRQIGGWFLPVSYTPPPETQTLPADAPALWLAAIMRNEQDSIVNMLQSVAPVATGFVLIDTGSTDDTILNARTYLETLQKPFVIQTHATDRFDNMRNAALDLVPNDAGWILMLDADEELCPEDHAPLLTLLRDATHDAYALPRYNFPGVDKSGETAPYPDRQVRLLRHGCTPPIRYSGAVHEKILGVDIGLLPLDAALLGQGRGGPHIHHLVRRFRSPEAEALKQMRYRDIAERYEIA